MAFAGTAFSYSEFLAKGRLGGAFRDLYPSRSEQAQHESGVGCWSTVGGEVGGKNQQVPRPHRRSWAQALPRGGNGLGNPRPPKVKAFISGEAERSRGRSWGPTVICEFGKLTTSGVFEQGVERGQAVQTYSWKVTSGAGTASRSWQTGGLTALW